MDGDQPIGTQRFIRPGRFAVRRHVDLLRTSSALCRAADARG